MSLPARLRRMAPDGLRDAPRLRALALGLGLIPPRTMHSEQDAALLLRAAEGARRVVEIGVYEGASALALQAVLPPGSELHLIDPYGSSPDALPAGWGASEWATRRCLARARAGGPEVLWRMRDENVEFLDKVVEQLLEVARISAPFVDQLAGKK